MTLSRPNTEQWIAALPWIFMEYRDLNRNRDSSLQLSRLQIGWFRVWFSAGGKRLFLLHKTTKLVMGSTLPLTNGYRVLFQPSQKKKSELETGDCCTEDWVGIYLLLLQLCKYIYFYCNYVNIFTSTATMYIYLRLLQLCKYIYFYCNYVNIFTSTATM